MSDYNHQRTRDAVDSIRDQRARNKVETAMFEAHREIERLRNRLATGTGKWGTFAKAVLYSIAESTKLDPRLTNMQWAAQLSTDTGEPEYTYACKECGAVRTFGSRTENPRDTAEDLIAEFARHRCLQHTIKCVRCSTNIRLVIPHTIDDEMAERQMVLWTEECASRGASAVNKPARLIGLGRIETKTAWVEINSEPAIEYLSIFAAGRDGQPTPMIAQFARVTVDEAKQIRARLDAWIFSREQLPTEPIGCTSCSGVGRYVMNRDNLRVNRLVDPCDKCRGHGRTKVDGTPLDGAPVPPQTRPRFGRGGGNGGSGRFA